MSKPRQFQEENQRHGGAFQRVARITCGKCGVSTAVNIKTPTGFLVPQAIKERFEHLRWEVGKSHNHDLCPACVLKKRQEKTALKVVSSTPAPEIAPSIQPPRQMDRDDRRIIFAKLNEVYIDPRRGYDSGWTDHRVATELGVPRKWVETVRVELFGENAGNEDIARFLTEADATVAEGRKILVTMRQFAERIDKLEKMAADFRKLVP